MLQIAKMAHQFWWAIMASAAAYLMPKMPKISIFHNFSKVCIFSSNIFQNEQNPTQTRKSGLNWNLSADWDFSDFSTMKKNLSDMRMDLVGICKMSGKWSIFFPVTIHFLKLPKIIFYRFWANVSPTENSMTFSDQKQQKRTLESSFEFPLSNWMMTRQKINL